MQYFEKTTMDDTTYSELWEQFRAKTISDDDKKHYLKSPIQGNGTTIQKEAQGVITYK